MESAKYWNDRYRSGVGAGAGSRGRLYEFKLRTVQDIVNRYKVKSVVDVGCGDGGQLMSLEVAKYHGLDISTIAIEAASSYATKNRIYQIIEPDTIAKGKVADMAISLDVIQHLPDDQFEAHIDLLFRLAKKYVLIYAPNHSGEGLKLASHMYFRESDGWIDIAVNHGFFESERLFNEYPADARLLPDTSFSEFFLYEMVKPTAKKGVDVKD